MHALPPLAPDLGPEDARPYFLWDTCMTLRDLRAALRAADPHVRLYWMARVMRDARYEDVWKVLTLRSMLEAWPDLEPRLGRERERWRFLIQGWRADGLIP